MKVTLFRDLPTERWWSMERYANELAAALRALGVEVTEYVPRRPFPQLQGAAHTLLNYAWRLGVYPLLARAHQGDINHIIDHSYAHLLYTLDARRTIVTCHDIAPLALNERGHGVSRIVFDAALKATQRASRLIAISHSTRAELLKFTSYPKEQIDVIWYGVNPEFGVSGSSLEIQTLRTSLNATHRPILLHVGSCAPRKNIEVIIHALSYLVDLNPLWVQVGGQFSASQRSLIAKKQLTSYVYQAPQATGRALFNWYHLADVFVFPSIYEGFGMPVLEALMAGLPTVTSTTTSLPEISGEATLLVAPDDAFSLAQAVRSILTDSNIRESLRIKGLEHSQKFTWQTTAQKTLEIYQAVYSQL